MKLHLPKGLRAALLAVVALASAPVASAAAPATFDYKVQKTPDYYRYSPEEGTRAIPMPVTTPAMTSSWVMSVAGILAPNRCSDNTNPTGAVLVGNVEVPGLSSNITKDKVQKPRNMKSDQFAIYCTSFGQNVFMVTKEGVENLTEDQGLSSLSGRSSQVEVTLQWVYNEAKGTGDLYLIGISDVTFGGYIYEGEATQDSVPVGREYTVNSVLNKSRVRLLKNVKVDTSENLAEFFTTVDGYFTSSHGPTEICTTLFSAGSGDDDKAWLITGTADVEGLLKGAYLTGVPATAESTVEGDDAVGDPGESAPTQPESHDPAMAPVQFTGSNGVLYLYAPAEEGTETLGEYVDDVYTLTYDRTTEVDNNILAGDAGMGVGFGADEGTRLIVGSTALSDAVKAAEMKIAGPGAVKLEMGDSTDINLVSLGAGSDLEIKSASRFDVDLTRTAVGAASSITRTADSEEGKMTVIAVSYDDLKKPVSVAMAGLSNENGDLDIEGSMNVADGVRYATLDVDTIAASGSIEMTGMITSDTVTAGGDLKVGTSSNPYGALTATSAKAGGKFAVHGAAEIGTIEAGSVEANMIEDEETSLKAGSIKTSALTYNLTTYEIAAPEPPAEEGGEVAPLTGETGEVNSISISTAEAGTLLSGNVSLNAAGISAGAIADDATIDMDSACGAQVKLGSATGLNLTLDGAASIMQGVTAGNLELASGSIKASTISTGTLNLADGYKLSGARVTAPVTRTSGTAINVEGTGVQLSNLNIGEGVVLTTPGSAEMTNVTIAAGNSFGGADGDAMTINKQPQQNNPSTLDSLTLTGTIDGDTLTLTELVISGEDLNFDAKTSYTLLTVNSGTLEDLTTKDTITLDIQSYVDAEVTMENGSIVITGVKSEGKFKDELTDTANRTATMEALDEIEDVEGGTPLAQLQKDLGQLFRYELADRQNLLSAISGASTTVLADSQRRGVQDVQKNLRNRVIQMGGGTNAGLTTDWDYVGLQAWAQADGGFISTDGSGDESGYDFNTWGATVGANLDLTANTVVGMSFSASYGELDVDSADNASGNNDAYYVSFFARHQKERWVQMLILTVGTNDMDLERTVGLGSNRYTGSGSTDGTTLSAYYEIGYTVGLNYEFTHILQPMVSLSLTSAKVDGYAEEGSIGNAGLTYDGDSYIYGTLGIGARYQGVLYETVHERNAVVEARALITQDFGDTTDEAMVGIGTSDLYKVKGADSTGTGFELGAGISLPVEQHTTLYADADVTFRPDSTGFRGNIGLRYDF